MLVLDRSEIYDTQHALLNILEDLTAEQGDFEAGQRALLNILDDAQVERTNLRGAQRAVLNILEDSEAEKVNLQGVQRAVLNILEDSEAEKLNLQGAQRAVLNILEDFDLEKSKVAAINRELQEEIEVRQRTQEEIRKLNQGLEQRVTERTAELAASNRELEAFAYSVSHDLRAPLRHLDGFLALLVNQSAGRLDETANRYLGKVTAASRTMGILIDDLLQFSRMGRSEVKRATVSLGRAVEEVRQELALEAAERRVLWRVGSLPDVMADPAMLRLAITNLLANALKFTRLRAEAQIEIGRLEGREDEDVIFVKDNGVGFDPRYMEKLFNVFQRLHPSSEFEGTGIGLANVRRIIERHGGRVWAEGAIGAGATFYFSLPRIPNQEAS